MPPVEHKRVVCFPGLNGLAMKQKKTHFLGQKERQHTVPGVIKLVFLWPFSSRGNGPPTEANVLLGDGIEDWLLAKPGVAWTERQKRCFLSFPRDPNTF